MKSPRIHGGWLSLSLAVLLPGCSGLAPAPPPRVVTGPVSPVHQPARHHYEHVAKPRPPAALVQLNRPLLRALERTAIPWEAPGFTDFRLAFPAATSTTAGTDTGTSVDSLPTIVVHPGRRGAPTAVKADEAVP